MAGRVLRPCGTDAAYQRHRRRGEPIDDVCRLAHNARTIEHRTPNKPRIAARERARRSAMEALRNMYPADWSRLYAAAVREEYERDGGAR